MTAPPCPSLALLCRDCEEALLAGSTAEAITYIPGILRAMDAESEEAK